MADADTGFFENYDVDTSPTSDLGWGDVAVPSSPSKVSIDPTDTLFSKLYGSVTTAVAAVADGAAQRVNSAGQTIGRRIAQPTPRQAQAQSAPTRKPVPTILIVAIAAAVIGMFMMFRR